jgi:hypothetical protein
LVNQDKLRSWIKTRLGRTTHSRHQQYLQRLHHTTIQKDKQNRLKEIVDKEKERKIRLDIFAAYIYDYKQFKNFIEELKDHPKYKHWFTLQTKRTSENFYKLLHMETVTEVEDIPNYEKEIVIGQIITDKKKQNMGKTIKNTTTSITNNEWGINEEMEYLDNVIKEVRFEKENMQNEETDFTQTRQKMMTKMKQGPQAKIENNNDNEKDGWEISGDKQKKIENKQTFESVSQHFIPTYLPLFESNVYDECKTKYRIPITVTIKPKPNTQGAFKSSRMLVAMLKALQMAYQDTYIGPIDKKSNHKNLTHHSQVPTEPTNLKNYMMKPVTGFNNTFSIKIIVCSNQELKTFLVEPNFRII